MKNRRVFFQPALGIVLCAVLVSAMAGGAQDAATKPTVVSAIINSTANPATITGADLLPATGSPVVKIDSATLTLVSSSSTQIVADLPAGLAAGSFLLQVGTGFFDVTNGAVGPQGPAGPAGPTGPAGATGATGAIGPPGTVTLPYSGTAYGDADPVFQITNTSPVHSAIGGIGAQAFSGAFNIGGTGVAGYGGPANNGNWGGHGMYALGGAGVSQGDAGGNGIDDYGGNAPSGETLDGPGGTGVKATGGNGQNGGDGIDATAGEGPTSAGSGVGVYAKGGLAGEFFGNVTIEELTVIGQFARAIVASEIANRSFMIKTDKPDVKVSWQVPGIRQDAWANAHRIQVEVDKAPRDRVHYIRPELFGHEGEPSISEIHPTRPQRPQQ